MQPKKAWYFMVDDSKQKIHMSYQVLFSPKNILNL